MGIIAFLDETGVSKLLAKSKDVFAPKQHTHSGKDIQDLPSVIIPEWELVGTAEGTTSVPLPSSFSELYIEVSYWSTHMTYLIPKNMLGNSDKYYIDGFYGSTSANGEFYIIASLDRVKIYEVFVDGSDVTGNCTIAVYKRVANDSSGGETGLLPMTSEEIDTEFNSVFSA